MYTRQHALYDSENTGLGLRKDDGRRRERREKADGWFFISLVSEVLCRWAQFLQLLNPPNDKLNSFFFKPQQDQAVN